MNSCPVVTSLFLFCLFLVVVVVGSNPKKPSAPDMFTESDDMFAADFDVSIQISSMDQNVDRLDFSIWNDSHFLRHVCRVQE